MADLTTKHRKALSGAQFGLPKTRQYPINDAAHARDAKARASEEYNKGKLSAGQKAEIDARANRVLKNHP